MMRSSFLRGLFVAGIPMAMCSAIGANAVVTKDVPAQHIAIGIPATNRPRKKDECIKLVDPDYYI